MANPGLDPATVPGALANRVLENETWARERLSAHAGRSFALTSIGIAVTFAIDEHGRLASKLGTRASADVTLRVAPLDVPPLLGDPARWDEFVQAEGDAALIATLKELATTLPWFVEQAFASALGPILGQRVADAGRQLLQLPEYAGKRVGASIASYAQDEAGLFARDRDSRAFADDVAALAKRVDAVEVRIAALSARRAPSKARRGA